MSFARRHPDVSFAVSALLLALVLAPLLRSPLYAIALVAIVAGAAIAWRSPVIPLALAGVPPIVDGAFGHDPLPSGGFTLLFSVWITAGVAFTVVRRRNQVAVQTTLASVSVLASVALLGLMLGRLGVSADQAYGSMKVQLYAADVLIILVGAVFAGSRADGLQLFLLVLLATDGAGALMFLGNIATGSAHLAFDGRYSLTSAEFPIDMGRASGEGLLLAIFTVMAGQSRRLRAGAAVLIPPLAIALAGAGSRGPVVAFCVGLATLVGLTATSRRGRQRLGVVAAVLLMAVIAVPLAVPSSTIGRALSTIVGSASGLSSNGRSQVWSIALTAFSHHLWAGMGTGGSATLVAGLDYPHNLILEIASELGLIGLITLIAVLGGFVRALARCWHATRGSERLLAALLIAMFVTWFVNAQFSEAIQGNGSVWLWGGLAIGMAARLRAGHRSSAPTTAS